MPRNLAIQHLKPHFGKHLCKDPGSVLEILSEEVANADQLLLE